MKVEFALICRSPFIKVEFALICKSLLTTGTEFTSCNKFLEDQGITRYSVTTYLKSSPAENGVKIVAMKLYRIMTQENSLEWVSHLKEVQTSYNRAKQGGKLMGYSPLDILQNKEAELKIRKRHAQLIINDYKKASKKSKKQPDLAIGTQVRVLKERKVFDKMYVPQFSDKIYKVARVILSAPRSYKLEGSTKTYYRNELSPLSDEVGHQPIQYKIQKTRQIPAKKNRSGKILSYDTEFLISPLNDPEQGKKWVTESELEKIKKQDGLRDTTIE